MLLSTDPALITPLQASLEEQGYAVERAQTGQDVLRQLYVSRPDLIILDGRPPKQRARRPAYEGEPAADRRADSSERRTPRLELLHRIRAVTELPILLFVSQAREAWGLNQGADDCLTVSVSPEVLAARVKALLRRARRPAITAWRTRYVDEHVNIDLMRRQVFVRGQRVHLTPLEFRLLACLVGEAGTVVSHETLITRVWGPDQVGKLHLLTPCIYNLRQKIEPDPAQYEYILTERGFGYRFRRPPRGL